MLCAPETRTVFKASLKASAGTSSWSSQSALYICFQFLVLSDDCHFCHDAVFSSCSLESSPVSFLSKHQSLYSFKYLSGVPSTAESVLICTVKSRLCTCIPFILGEEKKRKKKRAQLDLSWHCQEDSVIPHAEGDIVEMASSWRTCVLCI